MFGRAGWLVNAGFVNGARFVLLLPCEPAVWNIRQILPAARTATVTSLPEPGTMLTISTSLSLRFSDRRYSVGISSVILS